MLDIIDLNQKIIIAYALFLVVLLLMYIAFGPSRKHTRSK
jgi:hypothetical protein